VSSLDEFCDALVESAMLDIPSGRRTWTEAEDALLRRLNGHLLDEEIGELLGRTAVAVHLHCERDLRLPRPTTDPAYITAYRIATALGTDVHKTAAWIDRGLLPGEYIPRRDNHLHRRVLRTDFLAWLTNPENWVWFEPSKVRDEGLRELLRQAQEKWGDEWWTTRQVADHHGVGVGDVTRYIKQGKIMARHVANIGGRDRATWAYWFVLKSEATRPDLVFVKKKYKTKGRVLPCSS
jgi:hypothetical protein